MNNIDSLVLNAVIVIMPILMYLIYSAYVKIMNKEDKMFFELILITQMYLIIKFSLHIFKDVPLVLIDIPLIIAYTKKKQSLIFVFSLFIITIQSITPILILKYTLLYLIDKKVNDKLILYTIINTITMIILKIPLIEIMIVSPFIYIITSIIIYLLEKGNNMTNMQLQIQKLEKESQIKKSLFQITHEIKNPIAVCKGYLDMCDSDKKIDKYIPIIKEEIDRTLILLEDFLSMNKQKVNREILDVNLLLEDVVDNVEMLIKGENIKLDADISEDEIYINGDYNRLTQVLINILKNSIEALDGRQTPQIKLWTKIEDNYIDIYIKDNGVGIKKDILKKIKQPFYTTKIRGTGLGVSLSDEIIKAHEGYLNYESEEGKYTLVNIKMPLESI